MCGVGCAREDCGGSMGMLNETRLACWGNHPVEEAVVARPETVRGLGDALGYGRGRMADGSGGAGVVARGLGRSYGDASLNAGGLVVAMTRLDRVLGFDEERGVVRAEGGVSLGALVRSFLPRGWFLPVSPGTRFVTLGGAIAADVHGKNHHVDGSIAHFVEDVELVLASGEVVTCSRQHRPDLFSATVGGLGLTGLIRSASLRLRRVETSRVTVRYERARGLDEAFDVFGESGEGAGASRYSVAWIDCVARGSKLGRSVVMSGDHTAVDELPLGERDSALSLPRESRRRVPVTFPGWALNRWSVGVFNAAYYRVNGGRGERIEPYGDFFYPLDAIEGWNRIYGKGGFQQYQVVIPFEGAREGMREILTRIARSGRASFLAVLKTMGAESGGLLSFPMPGWTLALDLPNRPGLDELLDGLDEVVLGYGGRRYMVKDASMRAAHVPKMYPKLEAFRRVRREFDPDGVWSSSLSRRLGIDGGDG